MHSYATRSRTKKMKNRLNCLPPELLFEVLSWLPAKDLLNLRVMCKLWNSIICDRSFHQYHLHQLRKNNIHGCKYYLSSSDSDFSRSVNIRNSETLATIEEIKLCNSHYYDRYYISHIRGCVDGLVLFANSNLHDFENIVFLWNPTLRKIVDIPLYNSLMNTKDVTFGLGFDSVSNIYKVVALSFEKGDLQTMVYNLGSRSWTPPKVKSCSINNVKYLSITPDFVNFEGCVYWLATAEIMRNNNMETHCVCFNLSTEALTCSKVPDVKRVEGINYVWWRQLVVLHDSLALVDYSGDSDRHIRVWIRRKDSRTNSVFYWVELYNHDFSAKSYIYLTNNGNLYLQSWSLHRTVYVYDLKTGNEKVCSEIQEYINFMHGYLPSLVLL